MQRSPAWTTSRPAGACKSTCTCRTRNWHRVHRAMGTPARPNVIPASRSSSARRRRDLIKRGLCLEKGIELISLWPQDLSCAGVRAGARSPPALRGSQRGPLARRSLSRASGRSGAEKESRGQEANVRRSDSADATERSSPRPLNRHTAREQTYLSGLRGDSPGCPGPAVRFRRVNQQAPPGLALYRVQMSVKEAHACDPGSLRSVAHCCSSRAAPFLNLRRHVPVRASPRQ